MIFQGSAERPDPSRSQLKAVISPRGSLATDPFLQLSACSRRAGECERREEDYKPHPQGLQGQKEQMVSEAGKIAN